MSTIKGMNELINKLHGFGTEGDKFLRAEIEATGYQIEADAKSNVSAYASAPPELKQMISNQVSNNGYTTKITQNALPMGAYYEFGTGVYVQVTPEWKDMAWQFYVNGKGRLRAHPYMYPAFDKGRIALIKNMQKKLDLMARNFNRR